MHNLTEFLAKYKHWFLFVALEVLSMVLLFRFNDYQGSVWFTSANYVAGLAYEGSSKVTSYLTMGEVNEALTKRNLELERQVKELSAQLYDKTRILPFFIRSVSFPFKVPIDTGKGCCQFAG